MKWWNSVLLCVWCLVESPVAFGSPAHSHLTILADRFGSHVTNMVALLPARWRLCCVLKGDAYGHNATLLAPVAVASGCSDLCVVDNWEIAVGRAAGSVASVNVLRVRAATEKTMQDAAWANPIETVGSDAELAAVERISRAANRPTQVHINIDITMGRAGYRLTTADDFTALVNSIDEEWVDIVGVLTHLGGHPTLTTPQLVDFFLGLVCPVALTRTRPFTIHWGASSEYVRLINDSGVIVPPLSACEGPNIYYMLRPGSALYGYTSSLAQWIPSYGYLVHWTAVVSHVMQLEPGDGVGYGSSTVYRNTTTGTIPVGYSDGYPRGMKRDEVGYMVGYVSVNGTLCQLLTSPTMNVLIVDFTDLPKPPEPGDYINLLDDNIDLGNLSTWAGTSPTTLAFDITRALADDLLWELICANPYGVWVDYCPAVQQDVPTPPPEPGKGLGTGTVIGLVVAGFAGGMVAAVAVAYTARRVAQRNYRDLDEGEPNNTT